MSLPKSPLDAELLYLFVLGPGTGETILLRIPPGQWVVIDSYMNAGRPAAEAILGEFGGTVAAVILTHPHQDHCQGFIELIDDNAGAVIGCVHPCEGTDGVGVPTDPIALLNERAKPTYTRIWDEWQAVPGRAWRTFRHNELKVGDGILTSLHPTRPLGIKDWRGAAKNDMSSAIQFVWHNVNLLLGADVTNTSWPGIAAVFPDLSKHHALKVPHHASKEAIHESYGEGDSDRLWIITPFASSQRLPRSDAGHGLERALGYVGKAYLTSLPYSHDCEHEKPCCTTRSQIEANHRPVRTGIVTDDPHIRAHRFIVLAFSRSGELQGRWNGRGTLEVTN
jgi:hypothetical protein